MKPSGNDFAAAREALDLSQRELAAHADITQQAVSNVEQGGGSVATRRALAEALQTCVEQRTAAKHA